MAVERGRLKCNLTTQITVIIKLVLSWLPIAMTAVPHHTAPQSTVTKSPYLPKPENPRLVTVPHLVLRESLAVLSMVAVTVLHYSPSRPLLRSRRRILKHAYYLLPLVRLGLIMTLPCREPCPVGCTHLRIQTADTSVPGCLHAKGSKRAKPEPQIRLTI